ncbi:MAG: YidC/Oxa1 family membrane protein insertase [Tissierellia bacterium]|jgi:YidC/Oxa1 family membrane protein insertase|nr:YidC/Oxa1 family membrane protein insertase [Tissierellia bacterium]MDD3225913.1 YidC/Oxa1 family membrane protein insertase [Tissierellia bacterium]MDD3750748.1 YidC/Oxa1 family membrane protein insertase [Tissierellia bacterium]MDD4045840.1 YidC/Oxa1 family membrane protein insertase [Tissierellia bacterium]MDD4679226.1 YidC/Oxa1 family membrane protein insertase [Tissierellia bacterium]
MNLDFLAVPMGMLVKLIFDMVSVIDSTYISAYSIAIIISTILFKLVVLPLTLKQTKSMKRMQEINPKIQELQQKYGKDPQTLQRKQMELYKEMNYSPFSGCLPLLIQFPILIAFFYVIREPVKYVFEDQAFFDTINKTFLWIKDLGFAENHLFENGVINGLSMGGMTLPFIGGALPILAVITGITTYLTTKMTSQPSINEQQASTQKTMNMMMPVMIFVFSIQFPAGLALYWVVSNAFQLVQQYIVLNSSKNPKEELK